MSLKTKSVENYAVQSHGEATGVGRFGHRGEAEVEHGEGGDTGECGGGCRWGGGEGIVGMNGISPYQLLKMSNPQKTATYHTARKPMS